MPASRVKKITLTDVKELQRLVKSLQSIQNYTPNLPKEFNTRLKSMKKILERM